MGALFLLLSTLLGTSPAARVDEARAAVVRPRPAPVAAWSRVTDLRFLDPAAVFRPPGGLRRWLAPPRYSISTPVREVDRPDDLPTVMGPAGRPLVVIDAGHGGHDPGAIDPRSGVREKDVTLAMALAMRDRLLATGRMRVALTRSDDRFIILQERFNLARQMGARLFLSVHADSADNRDARGATIYTLSEVASDREAARLAARENRADPIGGADPARTGPVASILIGLTQRETMTSSSRFAGVLNRESAGVPFKPGYHRFASLVVLKAPDLPSVLYETGYMSNEADVAWLTSEAGRRAVADGVARAVSAHFARDLAGS